MEVREMTRDQLVNEVTKLRQQVSELEAAENVLECGLDAPSCSNESYRLLYENTPDLIAKCGIDGTCISANPAMIKCIGLPAEKVVGKSIYDFFPGHVADLRLGMTRTAVEEEKVISFEDEREGSYFHSIVILMTTPGGETCVQIIARDITESKMIGKALRESERRFRLMAENSLDYIFQVNREGETVYCSPAIERIVGYKPEERQGHHFSDVIAPLYAAKAQSLFEKVMAGEAVQDVEINLLRKDGGAVTVEVSVSPIIENGEVTSIFGMARNIGNRRRAEEALRESERKYRTLIENLPQKIFMKDRNLVWVSCNENFARDLGITPDEFAGKTDYDFFPAELAEKYRADDMRIMETGKTEEIEERYVSAGKVTWVHTIKTPVRDSRGEVVGILGIFRDISERKRTEEALGESEQRFRSLVETTSDWVWEVDQNGIYTYASPKVKDLLGYGPEEVVGKMPFDFMPVGEAQRVEKLFKAIAESRESFAGLQNTNFHKDGRHVVLDTSGVPILDANGNLLGYRGIDRDITERKQAEKALRESEQKYRALVENTNDIAYSMDAQGALTYLSPQVARYGIKPEETLSAGFWEFIHPDDREKLAGDIGQTLATGEEFPSEFRLIGRDGQVYWLEEEGRALRDESGRITGISGMLRDITARKQAEKALRESEEKYRSLVENAPNIIMIIERDGTIQFINHTVPGLTVEEAVGSSQYDYIEPDYHDIVKETVEQVFQTGRPGKYQIRGVGPGSVTSWYESHLSPVLHDDQVVAVTIIITDITERKQFARRLTQAHEEERHRISDQLHDDLGQLLTVAKIRLDRLRDAQFNDMVVLTRELSETSSLLNDALEKTRDLSRSLRPPLLDQLGLVSALKSLASQFEANTGTHVDIHVDDSDANLPKDLKMLFYRIVQEALTNVARHAEATEVRVILSADGDYAGLSVIDNGRGFDVGHFEQRTDCLGLYSMRSRVTDSGGVFGLTSEISVGTTVRVRMPLAGEKD